jgi:hypothetical protein
MMRNKYIKKIILIILISILFLLCSCLSLDYHQHGNPTNEIIVKSDVYIRSNIEQYSEYGLFYWKNKDKIEKDFKIYSLYVYNDQLYLLTKDKYEYSDSGKIAYYINNSKYYIGVVGEPSSIFVYNGEVYVAGRDGDKGFYWSENDGYQSVDNIWSISSIAVYNDIIYLLGDCGDYPCYWSDGQIFELEGVTAESMKIFDGSVYIAGSYYDSHRQPHACYWINGQINVLEPGKGIDITVDGNDIYVSGRNIHGHGSYWKNGDREDFNEIDAITGITYKNENLYFTGYKREESIDIFNGINNTYYTSYYWKNSQRNNLDNSN